VFIDWSQNADFKTTVCVYSLRASREIPYVSVPLKWQELKKALETHNLESLYFEPEDAILRAEKMGDLFSDVLQKKQKIPNNFAKQLKNIERLTAPLKGTKPRRLTRIAALTASRKATERESRSPR